MVQGGGQRNGAGALVDGEEAPNVAARDAVLNFSAWREKEGGGEGRVSAVVSRSFHCSNAFTLYPNLCGRTFLVPQSLLKVTLARQKATVSVG